MTRREMLIENCACRLFKEENRGPRIVWREVSFVERRSRNDDTPRALTEVERWRYRDRAERELIEKGKIKKKETLPSHLVV